ncbi:MAG TPA: hypothetical protein VMB52_00460 [Verrucomicrobiae bacterium]|nr:hypothetical protein [Verrucomicrobiae bacterium]
MAKFRIYALILGEILPEGEVFNCAIKKLPFDEQEERSFLPIQGVFSTNNIGQHDTYITSLPYIDPVRIKSEYVVVYDIEESDAKSALGGAIRHIDRLCRFLSITYLEDMQQYTSMEHFPFQPYIYQVNKIYLVNENGDETDPGFTLESGYVYSPDRPSANQWRHTDTPAFLDGLLAIHDDALERALKYLYRSSVGQFILDSPEKIALDHVKAVEIILDALSGKDKKFNFKLTEAKDKLGLTDEEVEKIKELWAVRSEYGDIAHASRFDEAERYPNQFPLPSNSTTRGLPSNSFAANICLKYFRYRQRLFRVELETPDSHHVDGTFVVINPHIETNHLRLHIANEPDKTQLKQKVKGAFARYKGINETEIVNLTLGPQRKLFDITVR